MGKIHILNFEEIKEVFKENENNKSNDTIDLSQIEINRLYLESKIIERYSLKKQKNNMQQSCMVAGGDGLLINGYNEGLLCIWDLKKILKEIIDNKRFLCNFEQYLIFLEYVHNAMIHICEFNKITGPGSHFITGSIDGNVLIWKIQSEALDHFRTLENPSHTYNISSLINTKDIISRNMSINISNSQKNNFTYPIFNIFKISETDKRTRSSVNACAWTCQNNYLIALISSKPKGKKQTSKQQNQNQNQNHNENPNHNQNQNQSFGNLNGKKLKEYKNLIKILSKF
jgi:WD40 repeat protein